MFSTVTLPEDLPGNATFTYAYDAASNLTSVTNPLNFVTTMAYNAINQVKSVTTPDPDGAGSQYTASTTLIGYDLAGNRTSVTDPIGRQMLWTYDDASRVVTTTQGLYFNTDYGYNQANQLVSVTGPAPDHNAPTANRLTTTYAYNPRGQLIEVSDNYDPLGAGFGRQTRYDFNLAGELDRFT